MDGQQPTRQQPIQRPTMDRQPVRQQRSLAKTLMMFLIAIILLVGGAGIGWWWRDKEAKDELSTKDAKITSLQAENTKLEKDLAEAKKTIASSETSKRPNQAALDNIKAAIVSGNTAALQSYMASTVRVIIAASEGVGDRTPTQAISDLKYIDSATDPWNFGLPAATLTKYQAGDYRQYFPTTAYVGKSANDFVISFQFDGSGKINGIFLASNANLL